VHFQLVEKEVKDVELFRGDVVKSDRRVGAALKINFYKLHEFTYKLHYIKNPGKSIIPCKNALAYFKNWLQRQ
jgi:hypothetical protein